MQLKISARCWLSGIDLNACSLFIHGTGKFLSQFSFHLAGQLPSITQHIIDDSGRKVLYMDVLRGFNLLL